MSTKSKGRGRPGPDANTIKHIVCELEKALNIEEKYMSNTKVFDQCNGEDALTARDGAARKLRFLKIWFELPTQVYLSCMNFLDRFLTKMKVKPMYLGCVSISCLYVAAEIHKCQLDLSKLVIISQTKCKVSDVERMSDIIREKLGLISGEPPVTAYNYLIHYLKVLECAANQLNVKTQFSNMIQKKSLLTRLEAVMLDQKCAMMRPSIAALALIENDLELFLAAVPTSNSPYYSVEMYQWLTVTYELQIISKMNPQQFSKCLSQIKHVMQTYDNNERKCAQLGLNLRFSSGQRPSSNFCTNLFVIRE